MREAKHEGGRGIWEFSVPFPQFGYEPKTVLKI